MNVQKKLMSEKIYPENTIDRDIASDHLEFLTGP